MSLNVRYATNEDLELLGPVNSSAKETLRRSYQRKEVMPLVDAIPSILVVAEIDGQLVGRCEYYIQNDELYFLSLGVVAAHRRSGILRKIFEFLEGVARKEHCKGIYCETVEETGNREIFEKLGLTVLSRNISHKYQAPTGEAVHELLMVKVL